MSPSPTSVICQPNDTGPGPGCGVSALLKSIPSLTWKSGKRSGMYHGYSCGLKPGKRDWPTYAQKMSSSKNTSRGSVSSRMTS
jgi:hypothetical protein